MKRIARLFLTRIALGCALSTAALAAYAAVPSAVAQALAAAGIPESSVALYVHEIGARQPLISHEAQRPLNPASTMKLVTTYAALELLGPAYTWSTEVYVAGALEEEVLAGNLIVKGYGDPKLTEENFRLLLRNLRARGVREIRGDVLLDRTYFALENFDPARFDGEPIRPYNTGPDALLVNFKSVTVQFVPDSGVGKVRLIAEPALDAAPIINNVVLTDGACGDWVSRLKFEPQGTVEATRLVISGRYARDCGERVRSFSLLSHHAYAAGLFNQLWRELGGSVSGTVREGVVPPGARLMFTVRSPALPEVVRDINKHSNNVMARQLFLTLGAVVEGAPGSVEKGRAAIRRWLRDKALPTSELTIENGSGLSRIERVTARGMGEMLLDAFRSPVMPEFISSLPIVAADGTMRKRAPDAEIAGRAHIKGGTLSGVRAIAGYVLDRESRRFVVVFIVNHPNAADAQTAQDVLLRWVHNANAHTVRARVPPE